MAEEEQKKRLFVAALITVATQLSGKTLDEMMEESERVENVDE